MAAEPLQGPDEAGGPTHMRSGRHWAGFLVSGGLAFLVDWVVLEAGIRLLQLQPYAARLVAISVAMLAGWLAHRRLTFAVTAPPSAVEFAKYAAAAWFSSALNYLLFVGALLVWPALTHVVALVLASLGAMVFSYMTMRYAVFRNRSRSQV